MIKAYLDCSGPRVTVHQNPNCASAQSKADRSQRHVVLNADTISRELARFRQGAHRFAVEPGMSDMWLILDFLDQEFEMALVSHLQRLLGRRHEIMKDCALQLHC